MGASLLSGSNTKSKRVPPWEKARAIVHIQEEERKRKAFQSEMKQRQQKAQFRSKNPSPLDSLEENRKRLADIKKRIQEDRAVE